MTLDEAKKNYPPMWVVYDHPRDSPRHFIARRWYGEFPTDDCLLAVDLERLRDCLVETHGMSTILIRHPSDDPAILEVWI